VLDLCERLDLDLAAWVMREVTFPNTMVDRITPHPSDEDMAVVERLTGWHDAAPVVSEPHSEWVIEDRFRFGAPDWSSVGAVLVPDVTPFEQRKLMLLNGGHSLLAYAGRILGHATVADAVADPRCRALLDHWWDEAAAVMQFTASELKDYRQHLLERWSNPRIRHRLEQIATDGSQKVPARIGAVVEHYRAAGEMPVTAATLIGAWVAHLRGRGAPVRDVDDGLVQQVRNGLSTAAAVAVARIAPALGDDRGFIERVREQIAMWEDIS
jgi:fructuronate reductase